MLNIFAKYSSGVLSVPPAERNSCSPKWPFAHHFRGTSPLSVLLFFPSWEAGSLIAFRNADILLQSFFVGGFVICTPHTHKAEKYHSSIAKLSVLLVYTFIYFCTGMRHIEIHYCVPDHCLSNAQNGGILLSLLDVVHYSDLTFAELILKPSSRMLEQLMKYTVNWVNCFFTAYLLRGKKLIPVI